jgi:hypothetical protein
MATPPGGKTGLIDTLVVDALLLAELVAWVVPVLEAVCCVLEVICCVLEGVGCWIVSVVVALLAMSEGRRYSERILSKREKGMRRVLKAAGLAVYESW